MKQYFINQNFAARFAAALLTIFVALTYGFAQAPTPSPTVYPQFPDNRFPNFPAQADPQMVANDDVFIFRQGNGGKLFWARGNDQNSNEIFITTKTQNVGNMSESSSFSGYSTSQREVIHYRDFASLNGTPPVNGVDTGKYFTALTDHTNSRIYYSNIADVTIFVIADDGAEYAGDTCKRDKLPGRKVGLPIDPITGNMWLEQSDYALPGIGETIKVNRFYNAIIQRNGLFGKGWTTPYDESIEAHGDLMVRLNMPDGQAVYLGRRDTNSPYNISPQKYIGEVVKNANGTFTMNFKDGRIHHFSSSGKLLWQKDRNGNQTTILYAANGALTGVVDPSGKTLNFLVTGGLVRQIGDSSGIIADYSYNPDGTLQNVTYADNSQYNYTYTAIGGKTYMTTVKDALNNVLEAHQYDSQGRALTSEKHGGVEKYTVDYTGTYNYYWNPYTVVTDALGRTTTYNFNMTDNGQSLVFLIQGNCNCGGSSQSMRYEYDAQLNVKKSTDALNRVTNYTYDARNNLLSKTDPAGTETFTYNNFGEVLTYTDRMGGVTTNTYDAQGKLLTTQNPLSQTTTLTYTASGQVATITDARNKTTGFSYNTLGLPSQTTDANGKNTVYGYDSRSRLTSRTNALNQTTQYQYDGANRLTKIIHPDAKFRTFVYDTAGRRTALIDERGNQTTFGYDNAHRLTSVTDALNHTTQTAYDLMSNVIATVDALGKVTDYEYDGFNRRTKTVYPAASTGATRLFEIFEYDQVGDLRKRTDTAGRATFYNYDGLDRLVETIDPDNKLTQIEYNARSQMTKVTDALNQQYLFTYDPLGRVLTKSRAGSTMSYQYDAVGNLLSRTDYKNVTTNYAYDNLNRLQSVTYPVAAENVAYTYDDLSRVLTATNYTGTLSFNYNARGKLVATTDVHGKIVEYDYDDAGNRTQLKLNNIVQSSYVYDQANRLMQITDDASGVYGFGYDAADRLLQKTLPNNVVTNYNYDGLDRLTRLQDTLGTNTLFDKQYAYNQASQISQIAEPALTKNINYDVLDRLTQVTNGTNPVEGYGYDAAGNRTGSHLSNAYSYVAFNRLSATQTASYVYDSNGNMVSKTDAGGVTQYVWDYENRLRQIIKPNAQTSGYEYDALGRRTKRLEGANYTKFTYDGQDALLDDDSVTGITRYQNGPGVDNKLKMTSGTTVRYFLQDHLGSTTALTDQTGSIVSSATYDSFGNATGSPGTRYQFTGREKDDFAGLIYYRARWYSPELGRFISEDPIGFEGGDINLFGYVHNNTINKTDPWGLLDPIVSQDPSQYNQDLNKISCEVGDKNPWVGLEGGGNFFLGTIGFGVGGGIEFNPLTGQVCLFFKVVPRVGIGAFVGVGFKVNTDFQQREQMTGGQEMQPEFALDAAIAKGGKGRIKYKAGKFIPDPFESKGIGGDASSSGVGIGFGPGAGIGFSVGIDLVKKYVLCTNPPTPCSCKL